MRETDQEMNKNGGNSQDNNQSFRSVDVSNGMMDRSNNIIQANSITSHQVGQDHEQNQVLRNTLPVSKLNCLLPC